VSVAVALTSAVAAVWLGRLTWRVGSGWRRAHRGGARHARAVRLAGKPAPNLGQDVVVVDSPEIAAYCVAGPLRTVVITRAAMESLKHDELAAVLAHENAHLAGRHHLLLTLVRSCRLALPNLPLFVVAEHEILQLLEMRADDVAADCHGRTSLVAGLVAMSGQPAPAGGLGAAGSSVLARALRMAEPPSRSQRAAAQLTLSASIATLAGLPGIALFAMALSTCPVMLG
jgi:Zn-dependent protease with chaperone function